MQIISVNLTNDCDGNQFNGADLVGMSKKNYYLGFFLATH